MPLYLQTQPTDSWSRSKGLVKQEEQVAGGPFLTGYGPCTTLGSCSLLAEHGFGAPILGFYSIQFSYRRTALLPIRRMQSLYARAQRYTMRQAEHACECALEPRQPYFELTRLNNSN